MHILRDECGLLYLKTLIDVAGNIQTLSRKFNQEDADEDQNF